jgi:hypothetical protein
MNKSNKKPITLSIEKDIINELKDQTKYINYLTGEKYQYTDLIRNELKCKKIAYKKLYKHLPLKPVCQYLINHEITEVIINITNNNNLSESKKIKIINFLTEKIYPIIQKEINRIFDKQEIIKTLGSEIAEKMIRSTPEERLIKRLKYNFKEKNIQEFFDFIFILYFNIISNSNENNNKIEKIEKISENIIKTINKIEKKQKALQNEKETLELLESWYELINELNILSQKYSQAINSNEKNDIITNEDWKNTINAILKMNKNELQFTIMDIKTYHKRSVEYKIENIKLLELCQKIEDIKNEYNWDDCPDTRKDEIKQDIIFDIRKSIENFDNTIGNKTILNRINAAYIKNSFNKLSLISENEEINEIITTMPQDENINIKNIE